MRLNWISANEIVGASGQRGKMTNRLTLDLRDGSTRKLLWLSVDRADVPLLAALATWRVATTSAGAFGLDS